MKRSLSLSVVAVVVAVALLACSASSLVPSSAGVATAVPTQATSNASNSTTTQPVVDLVNQQSQLVSLYQKVNPGVVEIIVSSQTSLGQGSGWVFDANGDIVTNNHVVEGATQVEVDFPSGDKVFAKVLGTDPNSDLAVVKVDPSAVKLVPLSLGDSTSLQVGQIVVAIGNPFGLSGTMTTGIISGLGRTVPSTGTTTANQPSFSTGDVIQTDAAINPGNSGGPLLDLNGNVVGVNSQYETSGVSTATSQPGNSGIGFAISVATVKRVVPSLITNGKFDYPYLGIESSGTVLPLYITQALGLQSPNGVYVTGVASGGPADKAGIRAGTTPLSISGTATGINSGGDLIVAADGQKINTYDDLITFLALHKSPGDTVTLTVLRGSQQVDIPVVLGTRP